jgi:prolyl oligopeptidase
MRRSSRLLAACVVLASSTAWADSLPTFPARDVPETFFGTVVDDPYRGLENVKDPQVVAWMKAHATHARTTLDSLPGYQGMKARIVELDATVSAVVGAVERREGGHLFFTRRAADANTFKLYHRGPDGRERLLADPDSWQKETGRPHAINYFSPSPDGRHVAYGISAAGSEDAAIHVIETATLKRVSGPIDRAQYPNLSWHPDSRSFFYLRQQEMKPGMPATDRYQDGRSWRHTVGTEPAQDVAIAGPGLYPQVAVRPTDFAFVVGVPGSKHALQLVIAGVQREIALYTAPLDTVGRPGTPWVRVCEFEDEVTSFAVNGDDVYLLTHRDSPRFSVIKTPLGAPDAKKAATVIAASEQVVVEIAAARDGLYFESRDGAVKRLKRLAWSGGAPVEVKLPLEGAASIMSASPDIDGAVVSLAAWTRAREIYAVDAAGQATNTGLQPLGPFDAPSDLVTAEVRVTSHDGALVPLSITHKRGLKLDGSNPALLYGYGSYGITEEPSFRASRLAWLERGGVYAVANVRGSGVYGQDWYKAGYKATKPNTWKDLIACAEHLVARNYTTSTKLGILGGSAGGILVGRAMTERPDLFAAVVPAVGVLDAVRTETTANGVPNIPEFGTVKKEDEFRALLAMSSYHHVKDGTAYPAVLLLHGVNDPRVDVWHSSKMAARLLAATTSGKPILLDLDYEAGHGVGSTKEQQQRNTADMYAFLFWQAGHPDFQPAGSK